MAPLHRLMRTWGSDGTWTGRSPSRTWKRQGSGGSYTYQFINQGSFTDDDTHELQWKTREQWDTLGIALPDAPVATPAPDTASTASASTATAVDGTSAGSAASASDEADPSHEEAMGQATEWDVDRLADAVGKAGIDGVCNSLSTAYLLGIVTPNPGLLGINRLLFTKIELFKRLLDYVTKAYSTANSADMSLAFVGWFRGQGLDWRWLSDLSGSNLNAYAESFTKYYHAQRNALPMRATTAVDGRFDALTRDSFYDTVDGLLEGTFSMDRNFQGLLVVKARRHHSSTGKVIGEGGHQLAFRYTASTYTFEIFDQNLGAVRKVIGEQEDIADMIADHLELYRSRPMPVMTPGGRKRSNGARFEMQIFP